MKKYLLLLFTVSFICLSTFSLGLFVNNIFFIISLFFGLLFILLQFSFLEEKILKTLNKLNYSSDNFYKNKNFDNTNAEEHPIIISAKKRLKK